MSRPRKWWDIESFNEAVDEYFIEENYPWTVTGLCIHLDIIRETLGNMEKDEKYFDTIKKAKLKIENFAENRLFGDGPHTGIIFNLKNNFGWKDKQEVENTNINASVELSEEEKKEKIKELLKKYPEFLDKYK